MEDIKGLWELQKLDNKVKEYQQQLETIESAGELEGLQETLTKEKGTLEEIAARQAELSQEIKRQEDELAVYGNKLEEQEKRLYEGQIGNSKELNQVQKKVEELKTRRSALEERVLELLLEQEALEREGKIVAARVGNLEEQMEEKRLSYQAQFHEMENELEDLAEKRKDIVSQVKKDWVQLYQELGSQKAGRAVAAVRGEVCYGCRISLPTNLVSQISRNQRLQRCPNCGRILYYEGVK